MVAAVVAAVVASRTKAESRSACLLILTRGVVVGAHAAALAFVSHCPPPLTLEQRRAPGIARIFLSLSLRHLLLTISLIFVSARTRLKTSQHTQHANEDASKRSNKERKAPHEK